MIGRTNITLCIMAASAALLVACAPEPARAPVNKDYATWCADCHGATGKGNGPAAASLRPAPTNLTTIAQRNGGVFPRLQVIGKINGHTMGSSDRDMPQFSEVLGGATTMYDAGDGTKVETPARLVALVEYLESIQAK